MDYDDKAIKNQSHYIHRFLSNRIQKKFLKDVTFNVVFWVFVFKSRDTNKKFNIMLVTFKV